MSRRSVPCEDCGKPIRARNRRCWTCYLARRLANATTQTACRFCAKAISNVHPACRDCADAYWRARRQEIRARQRREARCLACDRWHERATPGALFCWSCAARLDAITADIAALFRRPRHERAA